MKSNEEIEKLLIKHGWTVDCWSPLEISHLDGSEATEQAARIVIGFLAEAEAAGDVEE